MVSLYYKRLCITATFLFYPQLVILVIYVIGFLELSCRFIIYDSTVAWAGHYFIRDLVFTHTVPASQTAHYYLGAQIAFATFCYLVRLNEKQRATK